MNDLHIRRDRNAGRITLTRPQALNALTHDMANAIHAALDEWQGDPAVRLVIIDAEGDRAFCAGGDIAAVYHGGRAGDHGIGQRFFSDEYRMNAAIRDYPKPIVAFMQGFVMGGGVGIGGHASHRVVGDSTQVAMPESGIGLIPDVGGTWLLAHAPGRIGEYLGLTGARMGAGDAIHARFADLYLPEAEWEAVKDRLADTGNVAELKGRTPPPAPLAARDLSAYEAETVAEIIAALEVAGDEDSLKPIRRNSPLSMAATLAMVRAARDDARMQDSLTREYRFTHRATESSDFIEGVRAQIIDKDRNPNWSAPADPAAVAAMLAPLGPQDLSWEN